MLNKVLKHAGQQQERQLQAYIDRRNCSIHKAEFSFLASEVYCLSAHCAHLQALLGRLNARFVSLKDHTVIVSDKLLESLVFLKCN